jgi:hypothetical protein
MTAPAPNEPMPFNWNTDDIVRVGEKLKRATKKEAPGLVVTGAAAFLVASIIEFLKPCDECQEHGERIDLVDAMLLLNTLGVKMEHAIRNSEWIELQS